MTELKKVKRACKRVHYFMCTRLNKYDTIDLFISFGFGEVKTYAYNELININKSDISIGDDVEILELIELLALISHKELSKKLSYFYLTELYILIEGKPPQYERDLRLWKYNSK